MLATVFIHSMCPILLNCAFFTTPSSKKTVSSVQIVIVCSLYFELVFCPILFFVPVLIPLDQLFLVSERM
jgi:hypothetical protein